MRSARVLVVLLFLATSSTALAATKAIKFGKLVDGIGGVFTNAVVIVEEDRVQSGAPRITGGLKGYIGTLTGFFFCRSRTWGKSPPLMVPRLLRGSKRCRSYANSPT